MALSQADKKLKTVDGYENPFPSQAKNFYLNTDLADVYFICDGGSNFQRIPAHKIMMSVACDAFNAMFYGGLREPGDVRIDDASADGFKEFLKFFYFDRIKLTMEHIEEVVYLSTKYVYSSGIRICEQFLLDSLNTANVCFSYGLAIAYDLNELKQKCEGIITQNTLAVLKTAGSLECDKSVLAAILNSDILSCPEIYVFIWCMAWVKKAANAEKVTRQLIDELLGDSFRDIRFGSMPNEHLSKVLSKSSDLLVVDERQELFQLIATEDSRPVLFKKEPRLPWNRNDVIPWPVQEPKHDECHLSCFQEHESIRFSTNKHILLGAIFLNQFLAEGNFSIELLILQKSTLDTDVGNSQIILQQQVEVLDDLAQSIAVRLYKPLIFSPNFEYEIQLKIPPLPLDSRYSTTYGHDHYNRLMRNLKAKAIDRDTITMRELSEESLIDSFHFKIISSKDYRL